MVSFAEHCPEERLIRARDLLALRGPNDSGSWSEDPVALGHRRLAILDLSPAGHQPMHSADGRYIIVFNGEIYNYQRLRRELTPPDGGWKSNSDTEVILASYAQWGSECVSRFQGMFAFAIWDRSQRVLFAARDRMGVKPFYYSRSTAGFAFASRPRALRALDPAISPKLDHQAIRWYFEAGYVPAPATMHLAVRKLPAAHHLTLKDGKLQIQRYWDYCHIEPDETLKSRSVDSLVDELEELLGQAINDRLISDVPVGAFLSGGVDSSVVAGLMARQSSHPIRTFTIGFDEEQFDESGFALEASRHLGADHTCETLRTDDLINLLPTYGEQYDEPLCDNSAFPVMAVSRLAASQLPVVLTGDGADELFGGYHYYGIARHLARVEKLPFWLRRALPMAAGMLPSHRAQLLAGALRRQDPALRYAYVRGIAKDFDSVLSSDLHRSTVGGDALVAEIWERCPAHLNPAEAAMRADAGLTLPDDYLQKVDVGSMAFSLEARSPFLDYRLVEWSMRLPIDWKIRGGVHKYLLKQLAYRIFPRAFIDRPKMGFSVPIAKWLRGPLRSWARDQIEDRRLFENGVLDQNKVRALFALHLTEKRDVHPLLWSILMYLQFLDKVTKECSVERLQTTGAI